MAVFTGDNNSNTLTGGAGDDTLIGLGGNDVLIGNGGADVLDGGTGSDAASYTTSSAGLIVNLADPSQNTGDAAGDTYISIENIRGSAFADTLTGDDGNNALRGGAGADSLDGGAGFDFADYRGSATGLTASLANPASNTGDAAGDTYTSIEGLIGSDFNDRLTGDGGVNLLRGGLGADVLDGGGGFDYADYANATTGVTVNLANSAANTGEAAGDTFIAISAIRGGDFNDTLIGDANNNNLRGGLGADVLNGGLGFDVAEYSNSTAGLTVNLANPALNTGEAAGDTFISIEGLIGSAFDDQLFGDANNNSLRGDGGADQLDGGAGLDAASYTQSKVGLTVSLASPGVNTGEAAGDTYVSIEGLIGSAFDDTLIASSSGSFLQGNEGADTMIGGAGFDTVLYRNSASGVTVNLANAAANTGEAAGDTFTSIEGIIGSNFSDILIGNSAGNSLHGLGGADVLNGGGGTDIAEYAEASTGVVVSLSNPGQNTGEAAGDTFISIEGLGGSLFNDVLTGDGGNNLLMGNDGADQLNGLAGNDSLNGGAGIDTMTGGLGDDTYVVDNASDHVIEALHGGTDTVNTSVDYTIAAGQEIEVFTATGTNNITLTGNEFGQTINGNIGNNTLNGGGGADTLLGGIGADILNGGAGKDTMTGGAGLDRMVISSLTDSGVAFASRDVINTFAHGDKIDLSAIDANTHVAGNQAFTFVANFTGVAGQLQWDLTNISSTGVKGYLVQGDANGDGVADFSLQIYTAPTEHLAGGPSAWNLAAFDFVL
ncbi:MULTISPECIES: calcium-binding protein [Bradyrhizobium]|uniref:Calcium-binding protein n=1 Tax=Bradyrhizobium brasilense TaxID=1419277 RepID=A0ABY8JN31_9BRAD|nr:MULTISPECIES: calcium-binding protein [Bradyrhizobium]WFU66861.1 calcium-binding protein [Bradyrhizobium brasilense]